MPPVFWWRLDVGYHVAVLARHLKQVGGTFFHSYKGARNAPRGERFAGAIEAVKANARRLGGSFAVWGGLFSTFDCCLIAIRNKEDPYNSIVSPPLDSYPDNSIVTPRQYPACLLCVAVRTTAGA